MKKRRIAIRTGLIVLVSGVFIFFLVWLKAMLFPDSPVLTMYRREGPFVNAIRILQMTDLHSTSFDENNQVLLKMIEEAQPDLIVMTGDMLNEQDEDIHILLDLVHDTAEIAPVYYGFGNHEYKWEERTGKSLRTLLEAAGAVVLEREYADLEIKGNPVRIAGYMGYYRYPGMLTKDSAIKRQDLSFFDEYEATDAYKILLNHIPTAWMDWGNQDKFSVDLVFSGHYHGGLMRIPFLDRGIYAPYVGLFPKYTQGCFVGETATCVLSAGLGNEYTLLPRINNPPEIVVLDLIPEENQ